MPGLGISRKKKGSVSPTRATASRMNRVNTCQLRLSNWLIAKRPVLALWSVSMTIVNCFHMSCHCKCRHNEWSSGTTCLSCSAVKGDGDCYGSAAVTGIQVTSYWRQITSQLLTAIYIKRTRRFIFSKTVRDRTKLRLVNGIHGYQMMIRNMEIRIFVRHYPIPRPEKSTFSRMMKYDL